MKRFLLSWIFFFIVLNESKANTTTWIGASGSNWSISANWSNGIPGILDDAIINTSVTILFTTSPIDVNSMTVTNNASVIFNTSSTTTFRPRSTSVLLPALLINAGSSLTFDATNTGATINNTAMNMTFGGGVTGKIYGSLIFSSTGASSGSDIKLITSNTFTQYGIVTVYTGGSTVIMPGAGNTVSSLNPVATIVMKNGSIYDNQKNGGSFPIGNWEPNSLARASSPGANGPVFNGTSYGNLEWNCPFQTALAFLNANVSFNNVDFVSTNGAPFYVTTGLIGGNNTMTINGNLDIRAGSFVDMVRNNSAAGNSGRIVLKGDLNIEIGGTLITNGIPGTTSQLELQGSGNQDLTINGILGGISLEFIMNGITATLWTPLWLPGDGSAAGDDLQLVNGKILTSADNYLRLNDNATVSGGSTNSFVSGPMKKRGNDNFTFPVGVGSIYAPITITNVSGESTGDAFTAEYIRSNPQSTSPYGPNVGSGLDHVSYVEFWTLTQTNGTAAKNVTLDVHLTSFCKILANTYAARWSGTVWNKLTTNIATGPFTAGLYEIGSIVTTNSPSGFIAPQNAFTLSTNLSNDANPLPITLISFDACKLPNKQSAVNWELAACCSPTAKFEIQRAGTGNDFITIGEIRGNATHTSYNYIDNNLGLGINYYRLKMTDSDGTIRYSKTVAVMNGVKSLLLTSLIPTIITSSAVLNISSSNPQKLDLVIVDMQGRMVKRQNIAVASGNTSVELSLSALADGVYQITGFSAEGKTNTIRFIK